MRGVRRAARSGGGPLLDGGTSPWDAEQLDDDLIMRMDDDYYYDGEDGGGPEQTSAEPHEEEIWVLHFFTSKQKCFCILLKVFNLIPF